MNWLARLFRPSPPAPRTRALDAAGGGRRWASDPGMGSFAADLAAGGPTIRRRAAHYHRNNSYASRATAVLTSSLIGSGVKPQSEHADPIVRNAIDSAWTRWVDVADAAGQLDFYGLQALAVRSIVELGECFALLLIDDAGELRVQMIAVDQVDQTLHREISKEVRIISGVEVNNAGKRLAFHIFPTPPGDPFGRPTQATRIDAEHIVHAYEILSVGQQRGLPWSTPVLLKLADLDRYDDATLVRQKIAALFVGFLTQPDPAAPPLLKEGPPEEDGSVPSPLQPGTFQKLLPGEDVKFSEPPGPGPDYDQYMAMQLRAVAAGFGVTYEALTGDMRNVSYSSARVAMVEFRRRMEQIQQQIVARRFCQPIWQRWLEIAALAGKLPETAIGSAARWVPPAWDWVDPLKDSQAEQLAIHTGIKSRSEVIRERGRDPDAVLAEIAAERTAAAAAGVTFETGVPPTAGGQDSAD